MLGWPLACRAVVRFSAFIMLLAAGFCIFCSFYFPFGLFVCLPLLSRYTDFICFSSSL